MILGNDHFGIAVDDLEKAITFYKTTFGFKVVKRFMVEAIGAQAAMLRSEKAGIELFQFVDVGNELAQKIRKHSAFATDDIEADVQKFLDAGYELAIPISQGNVFKHFAYVKDKNGNYIELSETA